MSGLSRFSHHERCAAIVASVSPSCVKKAAARASSSSRSGSATALARAVMPNVSSAGFTDITSIQCMRGSAFRDMRPARSQNEPDGRQADDSLLGGCSKTKKPGGPEGAPGFVYVWKGVRKDHPRVPTCSGGSASPGCRSGCGNTDRSWWWERPGFLCGVRGSPACGFP